jgi:hypothetical protein
MRVLVALEGYAVGILCFRILTSNAKLLQDDGGLSQEISGSILAQPESFANEIIH